MKDIEILPGTCVQSVRGESDLDHNGRERHTGPVAWGLVRSLNHVDDEGVKNWDVVFENGTWVVLSSVELRDSPGYYIDDPNEPEDILLRIKYLCDEELLCYLDDPIVSLVQQLLDQTPDMLRTFREHRDLQRKIDKIADIIKD